MICITPCFLRLFIINMQKCMVRFHAPDLDVSERIYLGVVAENEFAMMDVVSEYLYSQKEESNKKAYRKSYVSRYAHE